jgi:2-dehydro-3-deoxygluconokinase
MGIAAAYVTALGDDPMGEHLRHAMQRLGIDTSHVVTRLGRNTGLYLVDVDAEGERRFHYYRAGSAASTFTAADLDLEWLRRARMLHVSGISQAISAGMREAVDVAARVVLGAGNMLSFDPNFRPALWPSARVAREAADSLPAPTLFAPSVSDLEALYPSRAVEEVAARHRERGTAVVLVKAGAKGAFLACDDFSGWIPAPRVSRARDTTAAGDAAVGVMAAGMLRGLPLQRAAELANRAAAFAVRRPGSVASLPTAAQISFGSIDT